MRFECIRPDASIKWYEIHLLPADGDRFAVLVTYGVRSKDNADDAILQPPENVFVGEYEDALDVIAKKTKERLSIGYKKLEPELDK